MSLFKITPDDVETFTLETYPRREYFSGSSLSATPGVSGTLYVFPRRSSNEKEVHALSNYKSSVFNDENLDARLNQAKSTGSLNTNTGRIQSYLNGVYLQQPSARKQQTLDIIRSVPSLFFDKTTLAKSLMTKNLMSYYRVSQPNQHFATSNYNCLNFFTASSVENNTAILYPNPAISGSYPNGLYSPTGSWSIDFWVNPKYTTDVPGADFKAGTILHLSGVYAVSLISGSSRDINGFVDGFRIQVQLSSSANISPSLALPSDPHIILSHDNSLKRNTWNHITIRNSPTYNFGTGSIFVNTTSSVDFAFTGSLSPKNLGGYTGTDGPSVLAVGNFYEGTNAGTSGISRFFAADTATRDGVFRLNTTNLVSLPLSFSFQHPLNAEIHDLKIFDKFLSTTDIKRFQSEGPSPTESNLLFYVPPFFTKEAPRQTFLNGSGGVLVTPFQTINDSPKDVFNVSMSFGAGGLYMGLENFGRDFVSGRYPRWLGITGSVINNTSDVLSANQFLFATASNRRRQYTVMPCDNGSFVPNFNFLNSGSLDKYKNDLGNTSLGYISLKEMVPFAKEKTLGIVNSGSILSAMLGATPDNLSGSFSNSLAVLRQTKDNSSNHIVYFNISNLFYGSYIKPGSVVLRDTSMSGSAGKISVTLKDDGFGNLFRADTTSKQAQWSTVGNVFYNEGLVLIKAPQLYFFGSESWELEFQGKQDIYILKFNLAMPPLMATSSSNPAYQNTLASNLANDTDKEQIVLLSGLNIHDDNLNVIMKTNFAQAIVKRTSDKLLFKVKLDF